MRLIFISGETRVVKLLSEKLTVIYIYLSFEWNITVILWERSYGYVYIV